MWHHSVVVKTLYVVVLLCMTSRINTGAPDATFFRQTQFFKSLSEDKFGKSFCDSAVPSVYKNHYLLLRDSGSKLISPTINLNIAATE